MRMLIGLFAGIVLIILALLWPQAAPAATGGLSAEADASEAQRPPCIDVAGLLARAEAQSRESGVSFTWYATTSPDGYPAVLLRFGFEPVLGAYVFDARRRCVTGVVIVPG